MEPNRLRDQSQPNVGSTSHAARNGPTPPGQNTLNPELAKATKNATVPLVVRKYPDGPGGQRTFNAESAALVGSGYELLSVDRTPGSPGVIVAAVSVIDLLAIAAGLGSFADGVRGHIVATFRLSPPTALPAAGVNRSPTEGVAVDHERKTESSPIADEAQRLRSSWSAGALEPAPAKRRIGWLAVGIAVCAVTLLSAYLAISESGGDPDDPGWADIAFFLSPFFAIAAAIVIGLTLVVVAARRLVDLTVGRAARAMVVGLVGGPIVYLAVLIAAASALDSAHSTPVEALVAFMFPAICGIGMTLIPALVLRR